MRTSSNDDDGLELFKNTLLCFNGIVSHLNLTSVYFRVQTSFFALPVSFPIDSSLQTWIISIAVPLVIGMPLEASKETGKTLSL